jgi:3',5'-cyclic AMP phosphodiesterase CpdA
MAPIPSPPERPVRRRAFIGSLLGGPAFLAAAAGAEDPPPALRLVHLSDTHCVHTKVNPRPRHGLDLHRKDLVRSFALLEAAVGRINTAIKPHLVIATGDLVDRPGDVRSLRRVKAILDRLDCPCYPVIGNHDGHRAWAEVFGRDRFNYAVERRGWRFIAVDSSRGRVDKVALAWLGKQLDAGDKTPTAVLLHHPLVLPQVYQIAYRRVYGVSVLLRNRREVLEVLRGHPNVRATFAGHCHVGIETDWGGITHFTAASLADTGHFFHVVEARGRTLRRTFETAEPRPPADR